ncbi:MAG: phage tail protein, partial [Vibrio sp.]
NFPTPCWWIKHHAVEPGTPVYWLSDDIPENALQIMDTDIDAGFYHRIAKAYPSLVADGKINLADILGRYVRVADGVDYLVNSTHEDAIRNITGGIPGIQHKNYSVSTGAFSREESGAPNTTLQDSATGGSGVYGHTFNASRVVPTASQNQPKSTMANIIIFI